MLFAAHIIRVQDSRSCASITRVLRSLVPEFQHENTSISPTTGASIDANVAAALREFFSTEVLRACINSMHEPYFAELHKDLAALVASIIHLYSLRTETPQHVLQSIPGMSESHVSERFEAVRNAKSERHQCGIVLNLLDSVRGTSKYGLGKIPKSARRSALEQQFRDLLAVDDGGRPVSPDLGGVANLLG